MRVTPGRYTVEVVLLVVLVVVACSVVPRGFPTVPYLSVVSLSSLKAASESVGSGELPEWDPYLGGGRPLAPTPYYLLYGFGRVGLAVLTSILSILALIPNVSGFLRVVMMLGSAAVGLLVPSPLPVLVTLYVLGLVGNCQLCRAVGALGIPDVAFCLELGREDPSAAVLTVSAACLIDSLVAMLGAGSRVLPSVITVLTVSFVMAVLVLLALATLVVLRGIHPELARWKRVGVSAVLLSVAQVCLYTAPTALSAPAVLVSALVLKYVDRSILSRLEGVRVAKTLVSLAIASAFVSCLHAVSHPKFTVVGEVSFGSGMKYVLSPDPRFTECVKAVSRGEPVWDAPLPLCPHWAPAALLGDRLGDPRVVPPPFPAPDLPVLPGVKVVLVASPPRWAESSSNCLELVRSFPRPFGGVEPPHLETPREIRGRGLVGQVYDLWWRGAVDCKGLLSVTGKATYDRPSAPLSVLLTFVGIVLALRGASRGFG
ncbi:hypothetical protein [Methanopyrus sp.]